MDSKQAMVMMASILCACSAAQERAVVKISNPENSALDRTLRLASVQITHSRGSCTGVIVGDGLVITAHHCLTFVEGRKIYAVGLKDFRYVYISPELGDWQKVKVLGYKLHPTRDLGVVRLEGLPISAPQIALNTERVVSQNDDLIITGYGQVFVNGRRDIEAEKNRILRWGRAKLKGTVGNMPSNWKAYRDALKLSGVSAVCPGDSGGGTFLKEGENWLLVGINSASYCAPSSGQSTETYLADPRGEAEWILAGP